MHLFFSSSFIFEFIFFLLLLILLLHFTGLTSTSNVDRLKHNQIITNSIKIIFYLIELFFILLLLKIYWWNSYTIIFNLINSYFSYSFKLFILLFCYSIKYSWLYSIILIANSFSWIFNFTISIFSITFITKLWTFLLFTNIIQLFNLIILINLLFFTNLYQILSLIIYTFNSKIILWLTTYNFLPNLGSLHQVIYTPNLYQYSLFDYSYFTFYNKYIIILFLIFYYLIIYLYYKIPSLNFNKLNSNNKFNYLFSYEYPILLGFLYLGYILVVSTNNLLIVYLGFEIQTFTILILSGQLRSLYMVTLTNLKYFFYSFFSSLTFLLSLLYLYNFTSTLNYYEMYLYLMYNWEFNLNNLFIYLGLLLLLLSFFFKLGVFPFYIWVLDIFEGFPRFITLLLLTLNKFNLFIFLLKFLTIISTFNLFIFNWLSHILTIVSLSSLFIGSLLALTQTNIHRFFGATSITHMGLLLLLIKITLFSTNYYIYYIIYSYFNLYMLLTFIFFGILLIWTSILNSQPTAINFKSNNFNFNFIKDLSWLNIYSKKSLLALIFILLNFSGFPPFSFFYIKFNLMWFLTDNQFYLDTLLILYFSTIITGSYIRLISIIFLENSINNSSNLNIYKYFLQFQSYNIIKIKYFINRFEFISCILVFFLLFYNYILYIL